MGNTSKSADIVVVGGGFVGLATAYQLRRRYQQKSILLVDRPHGRQSESAAGWLAGGMFDNYTRLSHVHAEKAAEVWKFGDHALAYTLDLADELQLPVLKAGRERLVVSQHELVEVEQACLELNSAGFSAQLLLGPDRGLQQRRVLARQREAAGGGYIDPLATLKALRAASGVEILHMEIARVVEQKTSMQLTSTDGRHVESEVLVLANHLGVRKLIPELAEVFVPVAEQWVEVELADPLPVEPGYAFSANHGYEWGVFLSPVVCRIGGGRFLRKLAGIGAEEALVDNKITDFLVTRLKETFLGIKDLKVLKTVAGLDCRPCDELPVVGPLFGNSRILLAGGFMGLGISQGLFAGLGLADLVVTGQSVALPRLIYPERLRSL